MAEKKPTKKDALKKAAPKKKAEPIAVFKAVEENGLWYATNGKVKDGPHTHHSVGGWVDRLNLKKG